MNSYTSYFTYRDGKLYCEDVSLEELVKQFGTPLYVYSSQCFKDNFMKLDAALHEIPHLVCYSVKSNSNINILRLMNSMGCGMDVVSGGELYRAIVAGVDPKNIVFAGVGKTVSEIQFALNVGVRMLNCESLQEIERVNACARECNTAANIAIRVNPDIESNTHHYITTGKKENKFGIALHMVPDVVKAVSEMSHVVLKGVHIHIGSQITQLQPFIDACKTALAVVEELRASNFSECTTINLGGGFGIQYRDENGFDVHQWGKEITALLKGKDLFTIIEPGRYISGNSGALITQVQYKKKTDTKTFIIVDAGMNMLMRPTLYGAYHHIVNLTQREKCEVVDIVGPICESGDFFAKEREMMFVEQGDYLAVLSAGAYGMAMASRYNSHPLPAEVLVEKNTYTLIRRRESFEDMISHEMGHGLHF